MAAVITAHLFLFAASSAILCASAQNIDMKEMKYIGSSSVLRSGKNARAVLDENFYFLGTSHVTWANAISNCKLVFGENSTIIAIETVEENAFVTDLLRQQVGLGTFWTSGLYNSRSKTWVWQGNGNPLPPTPWAPWKDGQLPPSPHPQLAVAISFRNQFDYDWIAIANTQRHQYICENPRGDVPVPCYQTNDLVVVMDASGSIGTANYEIAKAFVAKLASAFTVHEPSRLSVIVYSEIATTTITLNSGLTPKQIEDAILNSAYPGQSTATDLGINAAVDQFSTNARSVPLNMVVLTDGFSNDNAATVAAANRALANGIRTFSVGITSSVNPQEILAITGGNTNRVFSLETFDDLIKVLTPLSVRICSTTT